jgi:hypothetical protein
MQPGVMLTKDDAPETLDLNEQKIYRYVVVKIQFMAKWIRYDVSLRICWRFTMGSIASYYGISAQGSKFPGCIWAWKLMDWMVSLILNLIF